jgi:RimJ/RimL family protein N-acetyltransferase
MNLEKLGELNKKRRALRPLLSPSDPVDALASYYALWHDPRRTDLILHFGARRQVDGFITVSQTGIDLFRPLVTLRAPDRDAVGELIQAALEPSRPYQLVVPLSLASAVRQHLHFQSSALHRLFALRPSDFQPVVNVLVQRVSSADGTPRFQIESQGQIVAMSGTNWRSPAFAEVFVYVHPKGRGRGWGKSVVSACTAGLLEERLRPVYLVQQDNEASVRIAEALGYADTGAQEFTGEGRLKEESEP